MPNWKGIVCQSFTPEGFREYAAGLTFEEWTPEFIVLHNTEDPSLASRPNGLSEEHIRNLEKYYRDDCNWSSGPHIFVDDRQIWVFTPLTTPGTHANSWNDRTIGLEMLGDYRSEKFDSGRGLKVQKNAIAVAAILSRALGLSPDSIMLHRENGETEHYCPGDNVNKEKFIRAVVLYLEKLGNDTPAESTQDAAESPADDASGEPAPKPEVAQDEQAAPPVVQSVVGKDYQVIASSLIIRSGPGKNFAKLGKVASGEIVTPIFAWLPVLLEGDEIGWLSAQYLREVPPGSAPEEVKPTPAPAPGVAGGYDFSTKESTIEAIRAECIRQGIGSDAQVAYVLATVEWETGRTFKPVKEAYWKPEEWRQKNLARYYPYYGRGFVQLTWLDNYKKYSEITGFDLVEDPDLALNPETSLFILVHGFRTGAFTGKKITTYIDGDNIDFHNARRCINGTDKAVEISELAEGYLNA